MNSKSRHPSPLESESSRIKKLQDNLRQIWKTAISDLEDHMGKQFNPELRVQIDSVLDVGDHSNKDLEGTIDLSLLKMKRGLIDKIEDAMTRLNHRTYGICSECGLAIPEKRLMVLPFAQACVGCQENMELIESIDKEEDRPF